MGFDAMQLLDTSATAGGPREEWRQVDQRPVHSLKPLLSVRREPEGRCCAKALRYYKVAPTRCCSLLTQLEDVRRDRRSVSNDGTSSSSPQGLPRLRVSVDKEDSKHKARARACTHAHAHMHMHGAHHKNQPAGQGLRQ